MRIASRSILRISLILISSHQKLPKSMQIVSKTLKIIKSFNLKKSLLLVQQDSLKIQWLRHFDYGSSNQILSQKSNFISIRKKFQNNSCYKPCCIHQSMLSICQELSIHQVQTMKIPNIFLSLFQDQVPYVQQTSSTNYLEQTSDLEKPLSKNLQFQILFTTI